MALRTPGITAGIRGISGTEEMQGVTWILGNDPCDFWDNAWDRWDVEDIRDPWDNRDPGIGDIPGKKSQGCQRSNELRTITPETLVIKFVCL